MNDDSGPNDLENIAAAIRDVSQALFPHNVLPGSDPDGGTVASITEALMGQTKGLYAIAQSLESIAQAIRNK